MAHIVFLTLYLGLVSGRQPVELRADPEVTTMRLLLDGTTVATLNAPPWGVVIDFGRGIEPRELVAVGFDKSGAEVGRASQTINLPRPIAEAEIVMDHDAKGIPTAAEVRWRHLLGERPRRMTLKLDDRAIAVGRNAARLPKLDLATPHLISAELQFADGFARREFVFGGTMPDTAGSQLTATLVTQAGPSPASLEGCFLVDGRPIRAQALEKGEALAILIRDPNPHQAITALLPATAHASLSDQNVRRRTAELGADTRIRLMWPIAENVAAPDQPTSVLFPYSGDFDKLTGGTLWHLITSHGAKGDAGKRQFTDAVAVAGVQAITGGRRRAVILALGSAPDESRYDPPTVRRYLASIGVPLFVWSLDQVTPELTVAWGEVFELTNLQKLRDATDVVKKTLETQRIVWLNADPIHALHAQVKETCGLAMVAKPR